MTGADVLAWLREACMRYRFDALGVYQATSPAACWPFRAETPERLTAQLVAGGHLLPLPKEPAALANVIEVSVVDHLVAMAEAADGIKIRRGSERGYPDLELNGARFSEGFHAVDVKVAQRARTQTRTRTQSRITLYTGNTYFRWPDLHWPGTVRPFQDYDGHFDVIVLYTLDLSRRERATDVEVLVQEPWRVASRKRSSTTREYIGAVDLIEDLRAGRGEFETQEDFYRYWRAYSFRISVGVQRQLRRLVDVQAAELASLRARG